MNLKKLLLSITFIGISIAFAQKKNGTVYIEHPAINVVTEMTKAFVAGDSAKVASYLTDNFKDYNGTSTNPADSGINKSAYARMAKNWYNSLDYFSIAPSKGSYPDAIEYIKDNKEDVVWVQTWEDLKGVHKSTGVKVSMPMHRLFIVDKNNKIKTIIEYTNAMAGNEINQSFAERTNGTIYNHHEFINTIRKMIYAMENKDMEKAYSFYDAKARFSDLSMPYGKSISLNESKAGDKVFFDKYEIKSVDMIGYPDYLHYELGDSHVVLSWWNFHFIRKSDNKEFSVPVHFSDDFNKDGKIISEMAYYNPALFSK